MKLRTQGGKWYITDNGRVITYDNSTDAWRYIFLMKEIRKNPTTGNHELYPVRSLIPPLARGCKKVVLQNG